MSTCIVCSGKHHGNEFGFPPFSAGVLNSPDGEDAVFHGLTRMHRAVKAAGLDHRSPEALEIYLATAEAIGFIARATEELTARRFNNAAAAGLVAAIMEPQQGVSS